MAEHPDAMRTPRSFTVDVVLPGQGRGSRGSAVPAIDRREIYGQTLLRGTPYVGVAHDRLQGTDQHQARPAPDARNGLGSPVSQAEPEQGQRAAQEIPVSAQGARDHAAEPGLGYGHHLHSSEGRIRVSGGDPRLVQSVRGGVEVVGDAGYAVLSGRSRRGARGGPARDSQLRSGGAVHLPGIYRAPGSPEDSDQHGRAWPGPGQRVHGAAVADSQIRGSVPEGLHHGADGQRKPGRIFRVLQRRTAAPVAGGQDAGRDLLRGGLMGTGKQCRIKMAGRQNVNVDYLKHTLKLSNDWGVAPGMEERKSRMGSGRDMRASNILAGSPLNIWPEVSPAGAAEGFTNGTATEIRIPS